MADILDASGLTVETAAEITAALTAGFQGIYGPDINVDQNSPDGQAIGILTQLAVDLRELLVGINNSFDPDQAIGAQLDQRAAINGISRQGATYTIQPVDITVNANITLQGLDGNFNSPTGTGYTVSDNNGVLFILAATIALTPGTTSLQFRAQQLGSISVPVHTIQTPITIVAGVTGVDNSSAPTSVGQVQESDPQFRVRRQRSVSLTSNGYLNGLEAALLALPNVTGAAVYENVTDAVDGDGIPAHGIWAVVEGGSNADIANTIYMKKSDGANMKGSIVVNETSPTGVIVPIRFDAPVAAPLFLQFTIKQTTPGFSFDTVAIKAYIAANLTYEVGAFAETSVPTAVASAAIRSLGGGGVPLDMEISTDGITYTDFIASSKGSQFTVAAGDITINVVP